MAGSVNKVILVGNLGRDPEIRSFQNGGRIASFSIATSESWKDKTSGERKEKTQWHNISVKNDRLIDIVQRYVKKGSKLYIEGQLESRKYTDKDGVEKYITEVVLGPFRGELTMLDGSSGGGSRGGSDSFGPSDEPPSFPSSSSGSMGGSSGGGSDIDDSIPF